MEDVSASLSSSPVLTLSFFQSVEATAQRVVFLLI